MAIRGGSYLLAPNYSLASYLARTHCLMELGNQGPRVQESKSPRVQESKSPRLLLVDLSSPIVVVGISVPFSSARLSCSRMLYNHLTYHELLTKR